MKYLLVAVLGLILAAGVTFAEQHEGANITNKGESLCPKTLMAQDCLHCHAVVQGADGKYGFAVKELDPFEALDPPIDTTWDIVDGEMALRFSLDGAVDSASFHRCVRYAKRHPTVKRLIIDIYSPGGSLMGAWKIIAEMNELREKGWVVETRCYGFAASAGFLILANGKPAKAAKNAELMWHEVQQWKVIFGYDVTTPSDSAKRAKILRHFQDNSNAFLAERSGVDKKVIDEKIEFSEWWLYGEEALELGFVDALLP